MIDENGFLEWLKNNTSYGDKSCRDVVCRMKRIDRMMTWTDDSLYKYKIQELDEFQKMSIAVKSQCRKAIKLYAAFSEEIKN